MLPPPAGKLRIPPPCRPIFYPPPAAHHRAQVCPYPFSRRAKSIPSPRAILGALQFLRLPSLRLEKKSAPMCEQNPECPRERFAVSSFARQTREFLVCALWKYCLLDLIPASASFQMPSQTDLFLQSERMRERALLCTEKLRQ